VAKRDQKCQFCIAGLLNLRGSDIKYNPVFFSYVVVSMNEVHLFVDEVKVTPAVYNHFNEEDLQVTIHPYEKLQSFLTDQVEQNKY
jgi:Xaa-Pro aminopeptidase